MAKIRGFKPELWTDDDFIEVSPYARLLWMGMWNFACDNGHLQDKSKQLKGRVLPMDDVNCAELLRELDEQGLISRGDGWITVPNLTHHQKVDRRYFTTCAKDGCTKPEGNSEPKTRRAHAGTRRAPDVSTVGARGDGDGDGDGELKVINNVSAADAPDAPKSSAVAVIEIRQDVEQVCEHLAGAIEANGSKRPEITNRWRTAARLMLDKDKRGIEEIHGAIEWCQRDEFWRANVLSLPTLREKFDQLRLQAQRKTGGVGSRTEEWKSMQQRQMERAEAREREMGIR